MTDSNNLISDRQMDLSISIAQAPQHASLEPTMQLLFSGIFADNPIYFPKESSQQTKKRSLEQYDRYYPKESDSCVGEQPNAQKQDQTVKLIKKEPSRDEKIEQLTQMLKISSIKCKQLLEDNDWSINLAKAANDQQQKVVKTAVRVIVEEEKSAAREHSPTAAKFNIQRISSQQKNQDENVELLCAITGCSTNEVEAALKECQGNIEKAERYLVVASKQKIPSLLPIEDEPQRDTQESEHMRAVNLLQVLVGCTQNEAENALKECQGNIEKAERYLEVSKQKVPSQLPTDAQSQESQENKHTRSIALLQALTNCSQQEAEDALKECKGNIEMAEKLIQVQGVKQTDTQVAGDKIDLLKAPSEVQRVPSQQRLELPQRQLKELQEEANILQALIKCSPYTALEALKVLHDYKTAENFLRKAIDFCRGDEEQALRLITVNPLEFGAINELVPCQKRALEFIAMKAKGAHLSAYPKLVKRFESLGHDVIVLEQVLKYIRDDAPIIIHFNCNTVLEKFVNDTHYRSQFETNAHGAGYTPTRTTWESKLFGQHYDHCKPFDRPKYGVLNITSDLYGVASCAGYGSSYFVLREVRLRTTFVGQDSGGIAGRPDVNQLVATCQYYGNILQQFNDQELNEVIEIATGKYPFGKPKDTNERAAHAGMFMGPYKEVQLHGEIRFNKHIQTLCCRRKEWTRDQRKLDELLEQFRIFNPAVEVFDID